MSSRPVNTVATYTCTNGYTLSVPTTRTCGSDGEWSGNDPTCQRKSPLTTDHLSYVPPQLLSALTCLLTMELLITYSSGPANNRTVNTVATYTCTSGYTLSLVDTTRTCGSNGQWSGSAPVCQLQCVSVSEFSDYIFSCSVCTSLQVSALTCPQMESSPTTCTGSPNNRPVNTVAIRTPVPMAIFSVERVAELVHQKGSGMGRHRPVLVSLS